MSYKVKGTVHGVNVNESFKNKPSRGGISVSCYIGEDQIMTQGSSDGSPLVSYVSKATGRAVPVEEDDRIWLTMWVESWDFVDGQRVNVKPNGSLDSEIVAELKALKPGDPVEFDVADNATIKLFTPEGYDRAIKKLGRKSASVSVNDLAANLVN